MAQPTLYEALNSFNEQYLNALSQKSRRLIDKLDLQWQQINNYWDLYFQAKAEGNTVGADMAIDGIVQILGGDIDISVLPNIGGTETERDGVDSVLAVEAKINFTADIGTVNYRLVINLHSSAGVPLGYTLGALDTDGFTITPSFPGTLTYNAKIIS